MISGNRGHAIARRNYLMNITWRKIIICDYFEKNNDCVDCIIHSGLLTVDLGYWRCHKLDVMRYMK